MEIDTVGIQDWDRARGLGELLKRGRATFLSASKGWHWRADRGSQASRDNNALTKFDRSPDGENGVSSGATLIHEVVATYLEIGAGHLSGMGQLFCTGDVIFSPVPLARSVVENCARAQWVLGTGGRAEARLARAYLEEYLSSIEAKCAAGRLYGKDDRRHRVSEARWKEVRKRMMDIYPGSSTDSIGRKELGGEKQLGVTECVAWFYQVLSEHLGGNLEEKQALGLYDWLSSGTHPTLYQARQLREYVDHGDHAGTRLVMDISLLERLAGVVLVSYYSVLASTSNYYNAGSSPVEAFGDAIAEVVPGIFAPSTS